MKDHLYRSKLASLGKCITVARRAVKSRILVEFHKLVPVFGTVTAEVEFLVECLDGGLFWSPGSFLAAFSHGLTRYGAASEENLERSRLKLLLYKRAAGIWENKTHLESQACCVVCSLQLSVECRLQRSRGTKFPPRLTFERVGALTNHKSLDSVF
ncbi:unnamed protein product [Ixodes persulcatus]